MFSYAKGDRVRQEQYGPGTITESNDRHVVIDFDDYGPRRFVTSIVVLQATDEPAPSRTGRAARRKRVAAAAAPASRQIGDPASR